jgi:uncharacterized protein
MSEINFNRLNLSNRTLIESYLSNYSRMCLTTESFSSLMAWESIYQNQWAEAYNTLLFKFTDPESKKEQLSQPIGEFPEVLQQKLIHFADKLNYPIQINNVSEGFIQAFPEFTSRFELKKPRDLFSYIYSAEDLALLNGREYQPKRNLIHQFEKLYSWEVETMSISNCKDCIEVLDEMYAESDVKHDSDLSNELRALRFVLNHFSELQFQGLLLKVNGKSIAFSLYELSGSSTAKVCFEKALKAYKGVYQLINRETAKKILSAGYKYINREEDLGIEGLRKAKLSYHPIELCPSRILVYQGKGVNTNKCFFKRIVSVSS